jgi:hypothetical protein
MSKNKITLNNLEDLKQYQEYIKDDTFDISKFQGKIIDIIKKSIRDKLSQYIEIKHLKFERKMDNIRDNIFIRGNYNKDMNWETSTIQLDKDQKNMIASTTIDINDMNFENNRKIEFKFISQNRKIHDYDKKDKYRWETGDNRYILLNNIKKEIIKLYKENDNSSKCIENFKVKVNNNVEFEDEFSYEFQTKTLIIKCKDRDYQNNYLEKI